MRAALRAWGAEWFPLARTVTPGSVGVQRGPGCQGQRGTRVCHTEQAGSVGHGRLTEPPARSAPAV